MAASLTVQAVFERAILKEIESQMLYAELSRRISDKTAGAAFLEMAEQEQNHQRFLENYLCGDIGEGTLSHDEVVDYRIAEHMEEPEVTYEMQLKDVFLLAANREKMSHLFYSDLAEIHPDGNVRGLLEELAAQELEHKQRVEFLYTEVAFPQTDGG